jgi:hypothetical protein
MNDIINESTNTKNISIPDYINTRVNENNTNYTPDTTINTPVNKSLFEQVSNKNIDESLSSINKNLSDLGQMSDIGVAKILNDINTNVSELVRIKSILTNILTPDTFSIRVSDYTTAQNLSQLKESFGKATNIPIVPKVPGKIPV